MAAVPVFWNLPSGVLTGAAAASGIALVNSLGNLSGFVGPSVLGFITQATGSSRAGSRSWPCSCCWRRGSR